MPSTAGPRLYENHIPSFMSVYDMDSNTDNNTLGPLPKLSGSCYPPHSSQHETKQEQTNENAHIHIHSHQHRESTSTHTSDSTDSSPTTTISTVDSSSLSDPSPSSSPESPITIVPLSSFSGSTFGLDTFQSLKMPDPNTARLPLPSALNEERPMTSPGPRKPKNPKSLALNLSPTIDSFQTSEPSSPSFIKPPTLKGRRKPSLLSLNTGAANGLSVNIEPLASPRMPTMLQRRSLKHSVSSPQMLLTPGFAPVGGMTLGKLTPGLSNLAMRTFTIDEDMREPASGVQMATRVPGVSVGGDSFDRPHSGEDAKSPSYPDGPILMHEPTVHLYLEPKVEEAMKFDVVINVAREVKNPFKAAEGEAAAPENAVMEKSGPASTSAAPELKEPEPATSVLTFKTAYEELPSGSTESSPTTPKPAVEKKTPEYIHVPWDHNTDVKDELWDLCQLIEARVNEGKKVLVHCQQGASRSATLIIAYGMYINQDLGPNEAYAQAQAKSRWVNPNMSLLFSLNDFKKVIEKKKAEKNSTIRKTTVKHRPTLSSEATDSPTTPSRARGNSTPSISGWDRSRIEQDDIPPTESAIERLGAFDFGFADLSINNQNSTRDRNEWEPLMSPRLSEMTSPIQNFSLSYNSSQSTPPAAALFSPTAFEFPRNPFFPAPAAHRASMVLDEDPRSPPIQGEAPITRSIDDFL